LLNFQLSHPEQEEQQQQQHQQQANLRWEILRFLLLVMIDVKICLPGKAEKGKLIQFTAELLLALVWLANLLGFLFKK